MLTPPTRHEHIYKQIERNTIRTDTLPKPSALKKVLQGSQVILCTLSMISNPKLRELTQVVPIINVVIDEASQIEISQYVPLFKTFGRTLRNLCFIGDDKQRRAISFFLVPRYLMLYTLSSASSRPRRPKDLGQYFRGGPSEAICSFFGYTM